MTIPAGSPGILPPCDYQGKPPDPSKDFFAPPPPEIGPLVAGESNLKAGKRQVSPPVRVIVFFLFIAPALLIFFYGFQNHGDDATALYVVGIILGIILALIGWGITRYKAICSYVGETGAVRYRVVGKPGNPPKTELIDFNTAADLRTAQTRNYYNGVYTGTTYAFTWTDAAGKKLLALRGNYSSKVGTPKASSPYHFARVAEIAWGKFSVARADAELAQNGYLSFTISPQKTVIVGPGYIEFHFGGRVDRCEASDIRTITLAGGTFTIKHRDAKWYSSKGHFSFPYGQMANAQLFLLTLDRFLPQSTWAKG